MHTLVPGECRVHEMRTRGPPREGRPPSGASAPAHSDSSGSAAMRPGAAAPDDPEEVAPLPEPAAPSRRASRAWDRPVSAPPPPPGARPPAGRNAAVGADGLPDYEQERHPFEDTDPALERPAQRLWVPLTDGSWVITSSHGKMNRTVLRSPCMGRKEKWP